MENGNEFFDWFFSKGKKEKAFYGHAGRPGKVGGSVPASSGMSRTTGTAAIARMQGVAGSKIGGVSGESGGSKNKIIGVLQSDGAKIYEIIDASSLPEYSAIVVSKKGSEIFAAKDNEYHAEIIETVHPKSTVDDYIRFVFDGDSGFLETNPVSAGIVVNNKNDEVLALDFIYDALDKMVAKGLTPETKVSIALGFTGKIIKTTAGN